MEVLRLIVAGIMALLLLSPAALTGIPGFSDSDGETLSPALRAESKVHPGLSGGDHSSGCKNILAVNGATRGDCTLLLKVRDPARPGLQVLCSIPAGYRYRYHHPWTGFPLHFTVEHRFIGTTTAGDVPPNVTKPGMLLTQAGLALGDADTLSYLVNPTRHAWDDFDWMRYAAQSADTLEEAVELLTAEAVDRLHCTGVPENIFVAGPHGGRVVEADAYAYRVREVADVEVQSNYPKALWDVHILYPLLVAEDFNATFQGWVEQGHVVRLGGMSGIRVAKVDGDAATLRCFPLGGQQDLAPGAAAHLGSFYVEVQDIRDNRVHLSLCYHYYAWENKMRDHIRARQGDITVRDMMNWSRLHSADLGGLRGMCQGGYEAATVYRIPTAHPDVLSCLWFAPDQCSAIYVPVHICAENIYDPYESGEAHRVALHLLQQYGHGNLSRMFSAPEQRFREKVAETEREALGLLAQGKRDQAVRLLTLTDLEIQMEALAIQKMWLNLSHLPPDLERELAGELLDIWMHGGREPLAQAQSVISRRLSTGQDTTAVHLRNIRSLLQFVACP
ncbi:MAG: hypothetical protein PHZ19_07525 [Candidatus Thermoplasmatota archaeon]|nr:hypothetical protein [Candidatus Thermoplasmatota archaeon]